MTSDFLGNHGAIAACWPRRRARGNARPVAAVVGEHYDTAVTFRTLRPEDNRLAPRAAAASGPAASGPVTDSLSPSR